MKACFRLPLTFNEIFKCESIRSQGFACWFSADAKDFAIENRTNDHCQVSDADDETG